MQKSLIAFALSLVVASPALAGTITLINGTDGNFDGSSGTRLFVVTGLEAGYGTGEVLDVVISINFAKADGQAFDPPYPIAGPPFFDEIHFRLDHSATQVELIAPGSWTAGSPGQLFDGTIDFDDDAAQIVDFGAVPVAGMFRPSGAGVLADFNTLSALGNWSLFIQDTVTQDSLRFREATLTIVTRDLPPNDATGGVPEPGAMFLLGSGLAAIAARFRRRNA